MIRFSEIAQGVSRHVESTAKKSQYVNDPVLWAREILGVELWRAQRMILESVRDNRNTAVAAGHGVGKSYVSAIAMLWWVDVHPIDQVFVASTAPFQDQITAILWNNMRILHAKAKQRYDEGLIDHKLPGYITGDNKWKTDEGIMIGSGRKPPTGVGEQSGYQGLHATYLLAVGDEAAGLSKDMIDALGNITTGKNNRRLLIANPTDPNSEMAKIWSKNLASWTRLEISVFDSPLVTPDPEFDSSKADGLSGWDYINTKKDEWGEDDPRYISRVLGQWAFEAGNTVYTEAELALAGNTYVLPDPGSLPEFGVDIARMGSDASVIYEAIEGDVWTTDPETNEPVQVSGKRGLKIRKLKRWTKAPLVGSNPENLGSAERVHEAALAGGAFAVKVDASGIGSGVVDGLAMLNDGQYHVIEIFGSAAPSDKRAYVNMRAEQYFELKRRMNAGEIDLDATDEDLLDEMRGIVYEHSERGPIKIESKDSMKKRGKKSPDNADAVWYAAVDVKALLDPNYLEPGDVVRKEPDELIYEDFRSLALYGPGLPA